MQKITNSASHQNLQKVEKTLKIVCGASVGAIIKWSSALWPPDPPLQGGTKIFVRFQNLGFGQYENVWKLTLEKKIQKKVCCVTKTGDPG